ncbi:unnamed protein product [Tetraodon nigroviridis]|uniref:(spotted green pufferfish) hypothetical protein n=1 Tax=Tetraodon nigroviridis TaxID=99883 RepID=Q4TBG4_TETNG|nr:unnamed protein product [Tetraodon nigroviridis]
MWGCYRAGRLLGFQPAPWGSKEGSSSSSWATQSPLQVRAEPGWEPAKQPALVDQNRNRKWLGACLRQQRLLFSFEASRTERIREEIKTAGSGRWSDRARNLTFLLLGVFQVNNYQGPARVVVQLVTALHQSPQLHAHSLVGKQCEKGICTADLQPKDSSISFPNLGILHVTKKNVTKTLEERMVEAFRMGHNYGVCIHPEIDGQQGERSLISSAAAVQAKDMDLSVVRLMFTVFLPDSDGGFSRRLEPVVSDPIYDSKAPNASNLKIVRMDRTAGCVSGGEEVYLLCDKVQKGEERPASRGRAGLFSATCCLADDIQVRFYEEDDSGLTWEALGDFSPTDVHRQFAIVFKTPKYRDQNLQKPTSVFVQLKRKSDNETSEPKPFTYHPQVIGGSACRWSRPRPAGPSSALHSVCVCVRVRVCVCVRACVCAQTRRRCRGSDRRRCQTFTTFMEEEEEEGSTEAEVLGPEVLVLLEEEVGLGFFQGFTTYNYGGGGAGAGAGGFSTGYSAVLGGAGAGGAGGGAKHGEKNLRSTEGKASGSVSGAVLEVTSGQVEALFRYSVTGEAAHLLATQRSLMDAQDEDGDRSAAGAVERRGPGQSLPEQRAPPGCPPPPAGGAEEPGPGPVPAARPGRAERQEPPVPGALPLLHLSQTPLHLAVLTQQREAVQALLLAGADPTLADRHGNTPLHLASQQGGDGGMVGFLLQDEGMRGLLELPNRAGLCPIHLAVLANQLSSLRELLEGGANVESQERSCGRSALHLATERDNVSLAGCLLLEDPDAGTQVESDAPPFHRQGNANVDSCTFDGSTPLHVAAGRGSAKLTALLVAAGELESADLRMKSCLGAQP